MNIPWVSGAGYMALSWLWSPQLPKIKLQGLGATQLDSQVALDIIDITGVDLKPKDNPISDRKKAMTKHMFFFGLIETVMERERDMFFCSYRWREMTKWLLNIYKYSCAFRKKRNTHLFSDIRAEMEKIILCCPRKTHYFSHKS